MLRPFAAFALIVPLVCAGCAGGGGQAPEHGGPEHAHGDPHAGEHAHGHSHGHAHGEGDDATVRHRFDDAEHWASKFEDPARDAWQEPERVLRLLALDPAAKVADIGAATGYFPVRFARAVPQGVVYGVDVEANLVNYLNLRAQREGLSNLVSLVCAPDDPRLPEPVDLVFVCDTYHHIDARVAYFGALRARLRPGGRLVIVDFRPGDMPVGPPDPHKIAAEAVQAELERAGYRLTQQEELRYQYLLVFQPTT